MQRNQRGFTLPELLVVGVLVGALTTLAVLFLRPHDYSAEKRSAARWLAVAQHMQAISKYTAARGELPPGLDVEGMFVGSEEGTLNLCPLLVPTYAKDMLYDPVAGLHLDGEACSEPNALYTTGILVSRAADGTVTVEAPLAEGGEPIRLTKKF